MKGDISRLTGRLVAFTDLLFENVARLTKLHRVLICAAIFLSIGGGYYYFFYMPKAENLTQLKTAATSLEEQLKTAKIKAAQLPRLIKKMEKVQAEFKKASMALPDKKEIPSLLGDISRAGRDSGLEFLLFQPNAEIRKKFYAEIPVSIKVSGTYHQTALFLDRLSRLSRIVNVPAISLSPAKKVKDGDVKMLNVSCTAMTYRFVEKPATSKKKKRK